MPRAVPRFAAERESRLNCLLAGESARGAEGSSKKTCNPQDVIGEELMAHKKGLGSSRNGRDSNAQRLGVKLFDGQVVRAGMVIVRQRGTRFRPGPGTGIGKDDTIFAKRDGTLTFKTSGERRTVSVTE